MKGKARRLLSWVCVLALCMSLLPVTALAATTGSGTEGNPVTNTEDQVTVNKWVSEDEHGNYRLNMEAYASNVVTTESKTTPLDIVLVLDASGSMEEELSDGGLQYNEVYDLDNSTEYWIFNRNGSPRKVSYDSNRNQWYYNHGSHYREYVIPKTNAEDTEGDHVQFYTLEYVDSVTKWEALETAVNSFLSSVEAQNDAIDGTENGHKVALVKFAGEKTDKIENDTYEDDDYTYNYTQIVNGLTSNIFEVKQNLGDISPGGATSADYGLEHARTVLSESRNDAEKVVVFFTDGEPNHGNGFSGSVAEKAIDEARDMKDYGVTIYTVGVFQGASTNITQGDDEDRKMNRYMHAISSNYPDATGYRDWELGERATDSNYYFTAENAEGLNSVFQQIFEDIHSLQVYPDTKAELTDTLSKYFNFPDDISEEDVTVRCVPVDAETGEFDESASTTPPVSVDFDEDEDTISITGFDYVENAVTEKTTVDGKTVYSGGKLVVSFPIELDAVACGYKGGTYPTNDTTENKAGLYYKDKQGALQNNESTLLDKSPEVTVDASQVERQGTAININVVVDGTPMSEGDVGNYVTVTPSGGQFNENDDTVTYTFTYYDCKDIDFVAKEGYVIEAVDADLVYGQSECKGITDNNGTVTADNVQGGSTVTVYVRTLYTVQFHDASGGIISDKMVSNVVAGKTDSLTPQDPTVHRPQEGSHDGLTYINVCKTNGDGCNDANGDGVCDKHAPATAEGKQKSEHFTYVASLENEITLPELPTETGMAVNGWYLGSAAATETTYAPNTQYGISEEGDNADEANDNIINFYCTSTANTYTVTYSWDGLPDGAEATLPKETQHEYNSTVTVDTTYKNGTIMKVGHDTYTFNGWSTTDVGVKDGTFTMPAKNVTFTGIWEKTATDPQYTVSYEVIGDGPESFSGTIPEETQHYAGDPVKVADDLTATAENGTWTFSGWQTETEDVNVEDGTFTMPAKNVTFTGTWTFEPYFYTVTVEVVNGTATADGLSEGSTEGDTTTYYTLNVNHGENATISFAKKDGFALDTVTVNGDSAQLTEDSTYTFEDVTKDQEITVVYSTDVIGPDGPDDIPDKYQVTVNYTTDGEGKIADGATTTEVLTILDAGGNRVETGTVTATGSTAEAKNSNAFFFDHWTLKTSEEGTEINQDSLNATFEKYPLANVSGGDVITFKAYFTAKTYGLDVSKTLTSVGDTQITEDMTNVPMAKVGEDIVWTITVSNTGNQPLNQVTVTDTMIGEPSGSVSLTSNEEEENVSISGAVATIQTLEVGSSVEITATYEVQEADAGKSLNNTAVASDKDSHQDEETPTDPVVVEKPELSILKKAEITGTTVTLGDQINYTITVTNTGNVNLTNVTVTDNRMPNSVNVAIGEGEETSAEVSEGKVTIGTLAKGQDATITYSYTVTAADVVTGKVENSATGDSEQTAPTDPSTTETTVSDPGAVTVTPADITLYTGGTGYSGIVGNDGNIVDNPTNGLPEPGYYIELPEALNKALLDALNQEEGTVLDLSDYVTFTYDDGKNARTWALALYDEDGTSQAYGKNVYRLLPAAEGQDPVRLQITGDTVEEGGVLTDDVFEIHLDGDLYREYNMAIYSGTLDPGQVKLTFKTNNQLGELSGKSYSVDTESGALTIRGVTDSQETAVVGQKTDSGFSASVPNGTTYTINDSDIGVNDSSNIQLLVDDIVTAGDDADAAAVTEALQTKAAEALENTTLTNPTYEMKYMDLVDGNNGNVYVTPSQNVTITWPVRGDAAEGTDFYVVHFDGLDREFSGNDAVSEINATIPEVLTVTEAEDGSITFTTDSFSPFVLVYNQKDAAAPSLTVDKELTAVNGKTPGSSVSVNDTLTYTITVTNNGNVDLTGVSVKDTFNGKGTLNFVASSDYTVTNNNDGTYTITLNSNLAVDNSVKITATYKVLRGDANGTLTNAVSVTGKTTDGTEIPTPGEDTEETPVNPYRPPIRPPVDPDKPELNTEDHYAYIVGYEDGSVQPEGDITRAEVATIFFRLLTDESRNEYWSQTNPYSDVSADDWFNNAVSTLTNAGVLDGYEDGTFKPNGNITRAEFATITARFFEATYDGENLFPDIEGHWAQDYINEAANAGIVDGYEDGTFRPQQYITRAEAVTMVNRTIERHPDADHLLDDMITWPDNPETAWYYEQIQEATNSHEYTMNTDDEQNPYEIWTKLLPNRDWSELEKEWSDANDGAGSGEVV